MPMMKIDNNNNKELQLVVENADHVPIPYSIHDYSSFSGPYHPKNVCVNDPTEQSSRWSSNSHDQSQYITLKLDTPTVACEILFGKFHRSHVCNLKEFKIYGGLDPGDLKEILHKGLTDDNKSELFPIRYTFQDLIFPIQYIKITPLATFGANFNYSIWYIEVRGIKDKAIMKRVYEAYNSYKEMETIRLCLKHFRQRNMMEVYRALRQERPDIELEDSIVSTLHQKLVVEGDFKKAEEMIQDANKQGIFKAYVDEAKYIANWQQIQASDEDGNSPCARGGHQICLDPERQKIYVLGGWDGKQELADFWCYSIKGNRWRLISSDTSLQGGPSARSCHTICFDPTRKSIYVLGRYVDIRANSFDNASPPPENQYESELYQYFIDLDKWVLLSKNTQLDGGPSLLCDHQMCVDPIGRKLYVFGGRVIAADTPPYTYSGFYAYDLDECVWQTIRYDINNIPAASLVTQQQQQQQQAAASLSPRLLTVNEVPIGRRRSSNGTYVIPSPHASQTIKSRAGHSMLLDIKSGHIYIFGGQRGKETLTDLYCYSIEDDKMTELTHDFSKEYGPDAGYTQRAAINTEGQEIYISSGFLKNTQGQSGGNNKKQQQQQSVVTTNCFWVYHIKHNRWEKVFESNSSQHGDEPEARYTHQMVYNRKSNALFIFGGNPGDTIKPYRRLDDFWELKLAKPDSIQVVRRCLFLLRIQHLKELLKQHIDKEEALQYLRCHVTPTVDYENKEEVQEFKRVCTDLCVTLDDDAMLMADEDEVCFRDRTAVFQALLVFFPDHMKEPKGTLVDAVKIG
ncbi:MAG: Muskelin N-terminus-domain-containing protein [Benjaminiella poitrasii]|nr:MAG: Muskelin N-terminus-domain-containing protein [Benjaminiella poitrasii]